MWLIYMESDNTIQAHMDIKPKFEFDGENLCLDSAVVPSHCVRAVGLLLKVNTKKEYDW